MDGSSKTVDLGVVVAGVIWAAALALCLAATVSALGWHESAEGRMIGFTFMMFGLLHAAVAAALTVRVVIHRQTRYLVTLLRLMADSPDVPSLRRVR